MKKTFIWQRFSWKWKILLLLLLFLGGDYIRRRDFIEEERFIRYKTYPKQNNMVPEGYQVHGIDISKHNGEVWWAKISQCKVDSTPLAFVFIKATEGMFFFDKEFSDNWHSAKRYHMRRGAYHFFRPRLNETLQAWNFILNVRLKKGDLPPILDIEVDEGYSDAELTDFCKTWLQIIEKHYHVQPIIYTNVQFYNRVVRGKLDNYPLWIANYKQTKPQLPANQPWLFWQYSDRGRLEGINENVDLNVFNGDLHTLETLCLGYEIGNR